MKSLRNLLGVSRNMLLLGCLLASMSAAASAQGNQKDTLKSCSTPNATRITVYRFLAFSVYVYADNGDPQTALKLARALEVTYDATAYCFVKDGVSKEEAEKIDDLMDSFIGPIVDYAKKVPDRDAVTLAYHRYIDELDTLK